MLGWQGFGIGGRDGYLRGPLLARRDQHLAVQRHLNSCNTYQMIKFFSEAKITTRLQRITLAIVEHFCSNFVEAIAIEHQFGEGGP